MRELAKNVRIFKFATFGSPKAARLWYTRVQAERWQKLTFDCLDLVLLRARPEDRASNADFRLRFRWPLAGPWASAWLAGRVPEGFRGDDHILREERLVAIKRTLCNARICLRLEQAPTWLARGQPAYLTNLEAVLGCLELFSQHLDVILRSFTIA